MRVAKQWLRDIDAGGERASRARLRMAKDMVTIARGLGGDPVIWVSAVEWLLRGLA